MISLCFSILIDPEIEWANKFKEAEKENRNETSRSQLLRKSLWLSCWVKSVSQSVKFLLLPVYGGGLIKVVCVSHFISSNVELRLLFALHHLPFIALLSCSRCCRRQLMRDTLLFRVRSTHSQTWLPAPLHHHNHHQDHNPMARWRVVLFLEKQQQHLSTTSHVHWNKSDFTGTHKENCCWIASLHPLPSLLILLCSFNISEFICWFSYIAIERCFCCGDDSMKVLRLRKNNNYNIFSRFYHKPLNQKKNLCDLIAFQWHVMRKT